MKSKLLLRGALPPLVVVTWFAACGGRSDLLVGDGPEDASAGSSGKSGSAGSGKGGTTGSGGFTGGSGGSIGAGAFSGGGFGGGAVGAGGSVDCSDVQCKSVSTPVGVTIQACCSENGNCGLDMTPFAQVGIRFNPVCQERNQPGGPDATCPNGRFAVMGFNLTMPGCCRPNGFCGFTMDRLANIELGLGCVDSTPMLDGGTPPRCGGGGGAGGSTGSGGTTGGTCDVRFCPNFGFGQPCCVGRDGPCGFNFGGGCISIGRDGGFPGTGGAAGGSSVDAGPAGDVSCGNGSSVCNSGQKCCVTSAGPDTCAAGSATCQCGDGGCTVTEIRCDGPEDCNSGVCCAIFSNAEQRYLRSECRPQCNAQQLQFQMCHRGGSCPQGQTCSTSQFLPQNYLRCN